MPSKRFLNWSNVGTAGTHIDAPEIEHTTSEGRTYIPRYATDLRFRVHSRRFHESACRSAQPPNAAKLAARHRVTRKNFLFLGSEAGGERVAILYTVLETAKLNGLDPEAYLPTSSTALPRAIRSTVGRASALELEPTR
jgi:hypothetical protein